MASGGGSASWARGGPGAASAAWADTSLSPGARWRARRHSSTAHPGRAFASSNKFEAHFFAGENGAAAVAAVYRGASRAVPGAVTGRGEAQIGSGAAFGNGAPLCSSGVRKSEDLNFERKNSEAPVAEDDWRTAPREAGDGCRGGGVGGVELATTGRSRAGAGVGDAAPAPPPCAAQPLPASEAVTPGAARWSHYSEEDEAGGSDCSSGRGGNSALRVLYPGSDEDGCSAKSPVIVKVRRSPAKRRRAGSDGWPPAAASGVARRAGGAGGAASSSHGAFGADGTSGAFGAGGSRFWSSFRSRPRQSAPELSSVLHDELTGNFQRDNDRFFGEKDFDVGEMLPRAPPRPQRQHSAPGRSPQSLPRMTPPPRAPGSGGSSSLSTAAATPSRDASGGPKPFCHCPCRNCRGCALRGGGVAPPRRGRVRTAMSRALEWEAAGSHYAYDVNVIPERPLRRAQQRLLEVTELPFLILWVYLTYWVVIVSFTAGHSPRTVWLSAAVAGLLVGVGLNANAYKAVSVPQRRGAVRYHRYAQALAEDWRLRECQRAKGAGCGPAAAGGATGGGGDGIAGVAGVYSRARGGGRVGPSRAQLGAGFTGSDFAGSNFTGADLAGSNFGNGSGGGCATADLGGVGSSPAPVIDMKVDYGMVIRFFLIPFGVSVLSGLTNSNREHFVLVFPKDPVKLGVAVVAPAAVVSAAFIGRLLILWRARVRWSLKALFFNGALVD